MRCKAVRFAEDVLEDEDLADELDDLSVEDYADRKRVTITSPNKENRKMPSTPAINKKQLEDILDQVSDIVTEALDPALTRVDLVARLQDIDSLVNGTEYEEEDNDDADVEDDEDDEEEAA